MKIGIVANMLHDKPLGEALEYYRSLGIEAAEIGCGGYPGKRYRNLKIQWRLPAFPSAPLPAMEIPFIRTENLQPDITGICVMRQGWPVRWEWIL